MANILKNLSHEEILERIEWLKDDILYMRNVILNGNDNIAARKCIGRISADREQIAILEKDLKKAV